MNPSQRDRALEFLQSRINYERAAADTYGADEFKLDRMRELLERVGNPQQRVKIVHIAGTKGKGSTATMIASVLSQAGYRTGLFTSPHLDNVEERMAVDGRQATGDELVALLERLRPEVAAMDARAGRLPGEEGPTYFELTTVMAWLHFINHQATAVVLEVGMGGRLDSTNVCLPEVSVITSISLDHTRQLGNTLAAIAFEKAGIVKPGVPVVSGVIEPEPRHVIEQVCQQRDSQLCELGRDFEYRYRAPRQVERQSHASQIDFLSPRREYRDVSLSLLGRHQGANAAIALATLGELAVQGWKIDQRSLRAGLLAARSPARIEVIARRPAIVVDAAHNVASIAALLATLDESFAPGPRVLVFASSCDKDVRGMLSLLLPRFDAVLLTRSSKSPRAVPVDELLALAGELGAQHCQACPTAADAWQAARESLREDDLLCVTGSFFIAAEMRQEILNSLLPQGAESLLLPPKSPA